MVNFSSFRTKYSNYSNIRIIRIFEYSNYSNIIIGVPVGYSVREKVGIVVGGNFIGRIVGWGLVGRVVSSSVGVEVGPEGRVRGEKG